MGIVKQTASLTSLSLSLATKVRSGNFKNINTQTYALRVFKILNIRSNLNILRKRIKKIRRLKFIANDEQINIIASHLIILASLPHPAKRYPPVCQRRDQPPYPTRRD